LRKTEVKTMSKDTLDLEYIQTLSAKSLERVLKEKFMYHPIVVFTVDATHSEGKLLEVQNGYIVLGNIQGEDPVVENNSNDLQIEDPPKIYISTYYIVSFGLELDRTEA
jgi:hypothetical protein